MDKDFYREIQELAEKIAISTREIVIQEREKFLGNNVMIPFSAKTSAIDPVTVIDQLAEKHIRDTISKVRPDDGFLGEEYGYTPGISGINWIIDPIDGTVNFLYGLPNFSVSIAVAAKNIIIAGVVIDVAHNILYSAVVGEPSTALQLPTGQETKLFPSRATSLELALLGTGFSYDRKLREFQGNVIAKILPQVRDMRRLGSAALDLCLVSA